MFKRNNGPPFLQTRFAWFCKELNHTSSLQTDTLLLYGAEDCDGVAPLCVQMHHCRWEALHPTFPSRETVNEGVKKTEGKDVITTHELKHKIKEWRLKKPKGIGLYFFLTGNVIWYVINFHSLESLAKLLYYNISY